jgi:hypothetical protein
VLAAVLLASALKLLDVPSTVTATVAIVVAIVLLTLPRVVGRVRGDEPAPVTDAEHERDTISLPASLPGPTSPARETTSGANLR